MGVSRLSIFIARLKRWRWIWICRFKYGPFAVLDENDFPAVLAHAESFMAERGEEFGAEAPLINQKAIQYFVEHKYQIDSFSTIFMSNEPFGKFQNYLCFSPEFFM